jgi:DNA helicase TIP49 (TBP-interacting protein)
MNTNSAEVRRVNVGDIIQISENTVAVNSYRWFRTTDGYIADTSAFAVERVSTPPGQPPGSIILSQQQVAQIQAYLNDIDTASQAVRNILNSAGAAPP